MNLFKIAIALAFIGNALLGSLVFATSWRRAAARGFGVMSLLFAFYLGCLWGGANASTSRSAEFWIRMSNLAGTLLPLGFEILRHSIVSGKSVFRGNRHLVYWTLFMLPFAALCFTRFFILSASLPEGTGTVSVPHYGPGFLLYPVYFIVSAGCFIRRFVRDLQGTTDVRSLELQFVAVGTGSLFVYAIILLLLTMVTGIIETGRFLPVGIIFLDAFVAYGIATRRIMGVSYVMQRVTAYATLAVYLGVGYAIWWTAVDLTVHFVGVPAQFPYAHLVATLVVALSLVPAKGWAQKFARRLFISSPTTSIDDTIEKASRILQFVTHVDALLEQFSRVIVQDLRTGPVTILLSSNGSDSYGQHYPQASDDDGVSLAEDSVLIKSLQDSRDPIVLDLIDRTRSGSAVTEVTEAMSSLSAAVAVGIHTREGLAGVLLLGERVSGRIYDAMEQRALQLISDQLGVALENAQLYTALQDSKIYNDLIVDSLVSGLIATDPDGRITVMNQKAQEITGVHIDNMSEMTVSGLPPPLRRLLNDTISGGAKINDRDLVLGKPGGEEAPVRVSSSVFHGHEGGSRGALALISDMTELRKLEEQVRRTDRLSSLGTLSAGMAHEIKNPLVSIKTFTQLLPERYNDEDFRTTFFDLIGREIMRIDSIVNRLLRFARPAKASLILMDIQSVLRESLQLMQEQAKSRNVTLKTEFKADEVLIKGDSELLNQAFINFFLNAIEAMPSGGDLMVTTECLQPAYATMFDSEHAAAEILNIAITDTGIGMRPDDVKHVFDPFFTKKSNGTGLGLSVAHSILQEHNVAIHVESKLGEGTTISLSFPVALREGVAA